LKLLYYWTHSAHSGGVEAGAPPWLEAGYEGRGKQWAEEALGLGVEIFRRPPKPVPEEVARTWGREGAKEGQRRSIGKS
jgi:hypothetical protein